MREQFMALAAGLGLVFSLWMTGLACVYYASVCQNENVAVWFGVTGAALGSFTLPMLIATFKTLSDVRDEQRKREQQQ